MPQGRRAQSWHQQQRGLVAWRLLKARTPVEVGREDPCGVQDEVSHLGDGQHPYETSERGQLLVSCAAVVAARCTGHPTTRTCGC